MLRRFRHTFGELLKAESYRRSAPTKCRNKYERPMFWATLGATVAVMVSAAVGAWNTYYVGQQVAEMHAEQRAWIGAPKIAPHRLKPSGTWGFDYELENVGKLPPRGTYFGAHLFPVTQADVSQSKGEAEADCRAGLAERREKPDSYRSFSVIPGSSLKLRDEYTGGAVKTVFSTSQYNRADLARLHIVGCFVYSIDDGAPHTTKFSAPLDVGPAGVQVKEIYAIEPN